MMNRLIDEDRPLSPEDFKRGDRVIFVEVKDRIDVAEGTVSSRNGETVHIKYKWNDTGMICSRAFSSKPDYSNHLFPLWQILHASSTDNLIVMKTVVKEANEYCRLNEMEHGKIRMQVEREAREWRDNEIKKRSASFPCGYDYLVDIAQTFGFKVPQEDSKNG